MSMPDLDNASVYIPSQAEDNSSVSPHVMPRSLPADRPWGFNGQWDDREYVRGIDITDMPSEQQELIRAAEADPRLNLLNPAILDASRAATDSNRRLFDPRKSIGESCLCQNDASRMHRGTIQTYVSTELHRKVTVGHVPFPLLDQSVYKGLDIYDGLKFDDRTTCLSNIGRRLAMRTPPQIDGVEGIKVLTIYSVMWLGALTFDEEQLQQYIQTALRESGCSSFSFDSDDSAQLSGMYL